MREVPGSARLVLVDGVVHLDEETAVFEAMLSGWERQQHARLLGESTITARTALVRRFTEFCEARPWAWKPGDVEDFTVSLMSGAQRLAPSTIRGYQMTLRMFCDYLTDARYGWLRECATRTDLPMPAVRTRGQLLRRQLRPMHSARPRHCPAHYPGHRAYPGTADAGVRRDADLRSPADRALLAQPPTRTRTMGTRCDGVR
ncbi:hypothetical protein [Jiangella asiatica]|uniref:hypothetical protein n=1 Tax=Jiangella asiatica TaxID=2530372 RepID=UPI00193E5775|nr:hypothetical protein [Jiangella asiatica]